EDLLLKSVNGKLSRVAIAAVARDFNYKIPQSKVKNDDMLNLELFDQRIEDESRLEEVYDLVNIIAV
ncbi:hypothetical protein DYB32_009063, partial [Aphanomyces invadans]